MFGSNRKQNCYKILKDLKQEEDVLFCLADKEINYCLGCSSCMNHLETFCVIEDDMQELYQYMLKAEKIIIASPIYMNHISGILKNVIDRWNPYGSHEELLKGKTVYVITVGQMSEAENEEVANDIQKYFEGIGEFMEFEPVFLKNFSSGDVQDVDDVEKEMPNYQEMIKELKEKIDEKNRKRLETF